MSLELKEQMSEMQEKYDKETMDLKQHMGELEVRCVTNGPPPHHLNPPTYPPNPTKPPNNPATDPRNQTPHHRHRRHHPHHPRHPRHLRTTSSSKTRSRSWPPLTITLRSVVISRRGTI